MTVRPMDIVFSLAGHDKGSLYIVLKTDEISALLVDGKTRKLSTPKRKSLRHLCLGKMGSQELADEAAGGTLNDSAVRIELARFRSEAGMTEEGRQFVKR